MLVRLRTGGAKALRSVIVYKSFVFPVGSRIRSVHLLKSGPRFSTIPLVVKDTLLAFAVNDKPHFISVGRLIFRTQTCTTGCGFKSHLADQEQDGSSYERIPNLAD